MPGIMPRLGQQLREGRSVQRRLPDGLVEQDDAADVLGEARRREEQVAVGAPALLGRCQADRIEAFLDRPVALVGSKDALAGRDELSSGRLQNVGVHRSSRRCAV
jgi:hypothetical protein